MKNEHSYGIMLLCFCNLFYTIRFDLHTCPLFIFMINICFRMALQLWRKWKRPIGMRRKLKKQLNVWLRCVHFIISKILLMLLRKEPMRIGCFLQWTKYGPSWSFVFGTRIQWCVIPSHSLNHMFSWKVWHKMQRRENKNEK